MKNSRFFSISAALVMASALALAMSDVFAAPARAQQIGPVIELSTQRPQTGMQWMKAEIIRADARSMLVREQDNERAIYTFTYSDQLQPHMQKISDAGGYQNGDHVKILYVPGKLVAVKVHGKPSKPS
jgi:hypothetical protein